MDEHLLLKDMCFVEIIVPLNPLPLIFLTCFLSFFTGEVGSIYIKSIWVLIKSQIHIQTREIVNLLGPYVPMMFQTWGPIYYGIIICDLLFQPDPLYTLDNLVFPQCPITGYDAYRLRAKDTSNMIKQLDVWGGVYLMPQVSLFLINEGALPRDIIFK